MMVEDPGAKDDVNHADARQGGGMACVAKNELDGRVTRLSLLFKFLRWAINVNRRDRGRACLLGDEGVLAAGTPHTADVCKTATWRILADKFRHAVIVTQLVALPRPPATPQ